MPCKLKDGERGGGGSAGTPTSVSLLALIATHLLEKWDGQSLQAALPMSDYQG